VFPANRGGALSSEDYRKKMESMLDDLQGKLKEARTKAKSAVEGARADAEKQIGELEKKIVAAKGNLSKLGHTTGDAWKDLTESLDDARDDIASGIKKVMDRFR
jgi:F0F1-type ATP synthase membrane subunit b/b'